MVPDSSVALLKDSFDFCSELVIRHVAERVTAALLTPHAHPSPPRIPPFLDPLTCIKEQAPF